jgi:asparagine synthase (glutamine-hydrolysing)
MCGITGYLSANNLSDKLQIAALQQHHRGPDASGVWQKRYSDYHIGLGHTRLSIIDLSDHAAQPFVSASGQLALTYNGEIYNYRRLKNAMIFPWKSTSDTELLCEGLAQQGLDLLQKVQGMFAFAAWDIATETLFLVRDRIGIKPLYYYFDGNSVVFASELKAIQSFGLSLLMDMKAIYSFLHLGYIPAPMSIYTEIRKVMPGEVVSFKVESGVLKYRSRFYWKAEDVLVEKEVGSYTQSKLLLRDHLYKAVEDHLVADVEIGSFLSGGIDSSLVTAIARKVSGRKIKTFSIGFHESEKNELPHAAKVARYLQTDHHEFILSEADALEKVTALGEIYDEPFADSSAIPTLLVSEMAVKHVKVALSGDGGDELFLGYGMYQWARRLQNPVLNRIGPTAHFFARHGNSWPFRKLTMMLDSPDIKSLKSHIFSQEQQLFSQKELTLLLRGPAVEGSGIQQRFSTDSLLSPEEQQAFFDLKYYLPDDLLVKVDRASMHHSLEVRVPLLDHRVVEFALNLPLKYKVRQGERKLLLKSVLYEHLPNEFFDRPKAGFSIPLAKWLKGDLRYLLDKYLNRDVVEAVGAVDYYIVESLFRQFLSGQEYLYNRLWALVVLHQFLLSKSIR